MRCSGCLWTQPDEARIVLEKGAGYTGWISKMSALPVKL